MITLDFLIIADAATAESGKLNVLGGAITRITPLTLPTVSNLAAAMRIRIDSRDEVERVALNLTVTDPTGQTPATVSIGGPQISPPTGNPLPDEPLGVVMVASFPAFPIDHEGVYVFRLRSTDPAVDIDAEQRLAVAVVQPRFTRHSLDA